MTLVQGHSCSCRECLFVAPLYFSPPPKSEFSEQYFGLLGPKSSTAATDIPKYSEDDLQRIFKTILEDQAPAPTPASTPALAASKKLWDKSLKACSLDIYCGKSHMDCYNFCQ